MMTKIKPTVAALFVVLLAAPLASRASDDDALRQQFRDALTAARANPVQTQADSAALRDSVLYPYLQATRIQTRTSRDVPGSDAADAPPWLHELGRAAGREREGQDG